MNMDKAEALRYMGYRGQKMDDEIAGLLDRCIDEVKNISNASSIYEIRDIKSSEEGMCLEGTTLVLRGEDIEAYLDEAEKCAVMAATLGLEVDKRITFYSRTDLTKALIFDACATEAIEALCDTIEEEIKGKAKGMGLIATPRFSPGYGDFSIDIQKEIVKVLKTYERIGLSVNESGIMIPRKSVTAFIGLQRENWDKKEHKCRNCRDIGCRFRKDENNGEQRT